MIIIELESDNSQQMGHKKRCTASRQVSVLALCYSMKLDGIVRGVIDGDYTSYTDNDQ